MYCGRDPAHATKSFMTFARVGIALGGQTTRSSALTVDS
jgi:hypothetical protein